jgi:outer membrane protein assembly factor BamB
MFRTSSLKALFAAAALLAAAVAPMSADDWRGFRGQERQGVGTAPESPTHWSATRNILWKTRIHGAGHSSPVVAGPHVFVTTAYEASTTKRTLLVARRLRVGLSLAALVLWLLWRPRVRRSHEILGGMVVVLFVVLALADEQLFRFARSPARAWLGAALAMIVGFVLSTYGLRRPTATRRLLGVALGASGVLVVAGMPGGLEQPAPIAIGLAVVTAAAFLGCLFVLLGIFAPDGMAAPSMLPPRPGLLGRSVSAMPRIGPAWRACVIASAILGFLTTTVLVPRSGWVHAIASIDRATGRMLWIREGLYAPRTAVHSANSPATPTAVTDGKRVFAYFGTPGLMAVDTAGALLWTNTDVPFDTIYGVGASPVLAHDTLVVSGFVAEGPFLVAVDAGTGREMWRTSRVAVHPDFGDSRTPLVVTIQQRATIIVWGMDELAGYELSTGRELWRYLHGGNHRMGSMVASMVSNGDMLYLPLENGMIALRLSALAEGRDPVVWASRGGSSALATPVLYGGRIFAVSAVGMASCTDAMSGELLWRTRLQGQYYSSPIAAAGKVYFTNDSGSTTVVAAGPKYEVIAENDLEEMMSATMAAVDGKLYVRGHSHLYGIQPDAATQASAK